MTDDIVTKKEGRVGRITLTRPKALNALSYDMVSAIGRALEAWKGNADIDCILIDAEGDRAFCAGGDIDEMYRTGCAGDFDYGRKFWLDEYRVNDFIANYPKPYIAIMHGFVMGGGVGVSAHGSHRIVTDGSMVAMPECGIGLVPDVGGTHLLGLAPGYLGELMGLTGYRMGPGDAIHAGFADAYVPAEKLAALVDEIIQTGSPAAIDAFKAAPPESELVAHQAEIDAAFSKPDVASIMEALRGNEAGWAVRALGAIEKGSPIALLATLALVRRARAAKDVTAALKAEYAFTSRSMEHGDFLEGIRAAIIDKDRNPQWKYKSVGDVPADLIDMMLSEA